jgi:hypothetical protein
MDKKSVNTQIIDDMIEKLQKIKNSDQINYASYTRFAEATNAIKALENSLNNSYLPEEDNE